MARMNHKLSLHALMVIFLFYLSIIFFCFVRRMFFLGQNCHFINHYQIRKARYSILVYYTILFLVFKLQILILGCHLVRKGRCRQQLHTRQLRLLKLSLLVYQQMLPTSIRSLPVWRRLLQLRQ